jgi:hypothetical protein
VEKANAADLASLKIRPPEVAELEAVGTAIDGIRSRKIRERVDKSLAALRAESDDNDWLQSEAGQHWASLKTAGASTTAEYRQQLTAFLADYACLARFADGSVATGVVRRALATNFRGDVVVLSRRLADAGCYGGKVLASDLVLRLATAAEAAAALEPAIVTGSTTEPEP